MSDAERDLKLALRSSMDINGDVRKHHDPEEDKAIHRLTEKAINNAENQCEDRLLLGDVQGHSSCSRNGLDMDVVKPRRCSGDGTLCTFAGCLLGAQMA